MEDVPTQPIAAIQSNEKTVAAKGEEKAKGPEEMSLKGAPPSFLAGMKKKNPLHMRMNNQK